MTDKPGFRTDENGKIQEVPAGTKREGRPSYGGARREGGGSYGGTRREGGRSYGGPRREGGGSYGGPRREGGGSYGGPWREGGGNYSGPRREGGGSYGGPRREGGGSYGGPRREGGGSYSGPRREGGVTDKPGFRTDENGKIQDVPAGTKREGRPSFGGPRREGSGSYGGPRREGAGSYGGPRREGSGSYGGPRRDNEQGGNRYNKPQRRSDEGKAHRERFSRLEGKDKPRRVTVAIREVEDEMRLNKFLAHAGVAARRKADEFIEAGEVMVNGVVVTELGTKVRPATDVIKYRGNEVTVDNQLIYIVLNKPKDTIATVDDEKGRRTVMELIPNLHRVFPVGRLDRNTTGVLLLTNDGDLAYALMHPKFEVEKAYIAELDRKISAPDVNRLQNGIRLDDGMTAPCKAEVVDPPYGLTVGLILHEGRNRQVRRMFEALDYDVRKLERIQYAGITAAGLKRGGWRYLEENEVAGLKKLAAAFELENAE